MGYNAVAHNTDLSSFFYPLLPPNHEITRNFDKIWPYTTAVQGHQGLL